MLKYLVVWLVFINMMGILNGDMLEPVKASVNVKEFATVTLEWRSDFPLSNLFYLHLKFKSPGQASFGLKPIATVNNEQPAKKNIPPFNTKITTVLISEKTSNSFNFKITISNMAITEEGQYKLERHDPNGELGYISSIISAGVIVRPLIKPGVTNPTYQEGRDVQMKCTVTAGNPKPLNFRWYFTPQGGVEGPVTEYIKAVDTTYYNMTKITYKAKGKYTCVVSNDFGQSDKLDISLSVLHPPYIRSPPLNRTVFESDGSTEFSCDASGNPSDNMIYSWYKGSQFVEIKANTANIVLDGPRLRFINPKRDLASLYSCSARNIYGPGDREGAYLTVTYVPEPVEFPEINNKVSNVNEGHNVTVRCYSDAVPPATYSWYRKYKDFRGQLREEKLGQDNKSGLMTLYNVKINDTGEYKCIAYNYPDDKNRIKQYSKQETMEIKVMFGPLRTNMTVNGFNQSRIEVQVTENDPVIIECKSHSEPAATYNIQHNNVQLNSDPAVGYVKIDKMTVDKDGDYLCIASNQNLGNKEIRRLKILTAIVPESAAPYPTDRNANEGSTVRLECNANARPAPKVFWTKDGRNITNFNDGVISSTYEITRQPTTNDKLYRIRAVLIFTSIRPSDEALYKCIIHNGAGRAVIASRFTVYYAPKFLTPLQNYTVKALTSDILFTCSVQAKPDDVFYRWFFNDGEISVTTSTLERKIAKRELSGTYKCEARNLVGRRNSTVGTLLVTYPPKITFITPKLIADPFQSVTLRCVAEGVPEPAIVWSKGGDPSFKHYGTDMTLRNIKHADKGLYYCEARNSDGGDSKEVVLLVRHKPVITTTSPADTKVGVDVGDMVTLFCRADGYPLPNIFWKEKGASGNLVNGVGPYTIEPKESHFGRQSKLKFKASSIGTKYVCTAMNEKSESISQEFQVLGKGKPDPPVKINTPTDILQSDFPVVVNITLSWVPGFSGGYPVSYTLYYREKNDFTDRSYEKYEIGPAEENTFFFINRKPSTTYELAMAASNAAGKSVMSQPVEFKTRDAPPAVADVTFLPGDDRKSIIVSWRILKDPVPARVKRNTGSVVLKWKYGLVRYQVVNSASWKEERIDDIPRNGTYVVTGLDASESYNIHFVLYDTHDNHATPVGIPAPLLLGDPKPAATSGLSPTDRIAIGVGCGGALLLIVVIVLFIIIHKKNNSGKKSKKYNDPRVQVDIPVNTMRSNYSGDVVRASYLNEDDPYNLDSTVIDEPTTSPPPEYNGLHHYADPPLDYGDNVYHTGDRKKTGDEPTPSYTSFGRMALKDKNKGSANYTQSMNQLNNGSRAAEISRGNERNRYSLDNLDDYPEDAASHPLIQNNERQAKVRNSRGRLSSDEDIRQPPPFMKDPIRSPPSDEGELNRAPGAFGDRAQRFKKPPQKPNDQPPPPPPPNGFHQNVNGRGRVSPPSSVASSKPYRSDNEYIDEQDDKYVGFLV